MSEQSINSLNIPSIQNNKPIHFQQNPVPAMQGSTAMQGVPKNVGDTELGNRVKNSSDMATSPYTLPVGLGTWYIIAQGMDKFSKKCNGTYDESILGKITGKADKLSNKVTESMNVSQGKLILGMYVDSKKPDDKYVALLYNAILGGNANSKLFQNVREKASLAYTASSSYIRPKNIIFIKCGIEIENEAKTLEIIEKQLQDIKKGEFSEEEIEICKKQIISAIKGIPEGQDTEIIYYYGQEIAGENVSLEEYIQKVNAVTKQDIIALAQMINVHTVYFLKD